MKSIIYNHSIFTDRLIHMISSQTSSQKIKLRNVHDVKLQYILKSFSRFS